MSVLSVTSGHDSGGCVGEKQNDDNKVTVNVSELLAIAYVSFYCNKGNVHNLQSVVLSHFSPGDIAEAKRMLLVQGTAC